MLNTVIFELGPETQKKLDLILKALQGRADHKPVEPVDVHPVIDPFEAPTPVAEPEPAEEPKYTKDDLLALVQKLAAPTSSKREQAKAIVKSYASKVSAVPEDKIDEVMDKLTALQEG